MNMTVANANLRRNSKIDYNSSLHFRPKLSIWTRLFNLLHGLTVSSRWHPCYRTSPTVLADGSVATGHLMRRLSDRRIEYRHMDITEEFLHGWDQANQM